MLLPTLPLWAMLAPGAWTPPARAANAGIVLGLIPANATVETDIGLMSYAVADHDVFWLGNPNPAPDCLLIDRVAGTPQDWGDVLEVAERLHPETTWDVIAQLDGIELACRSGVVPAS
ncbi:hypothetical protein ET445_09595 [Agromyces protaetiae]|uniref:Uncharacterized protein n=1 Tax=Agromyces protaetiae TaxID=2509455 RepID=A0A4P6FCG2_9MICO|nr:hypothetical protein [Agromyces protaetiae]QAY73554.1 hypothetical protein ET445_09595 [Agromyces protaetiae]